MVSNADREHPGKLVARAHTADHYDGVYLPGTLPADTPDELHAQFPGELTWCGRAFFDPPDVVEVWG